MIIIPHFKFELAGPEFRRMKSESATLNIMVQLKLQSAPKKYSTLS